MLELHCHTTCSDGTLTPTQLVRAALATGVKVLAITDHDTLAGWTEAIAAAAGTGLEIVPGLELSTRENGQAIHILGFYPDPDRLMPFLQERLAGRQRRAIAITEKLRSLGYPIPLPQRPDGAACGRPHLAAALVQAGHVETVEEAFDRFLKDGGPAYVPYEPLSAEEGIHELRCAGAVPVWAHPYLWKGGGVAKVLPNFIAAGLMGLEVYHPSHMPHQRQALLGLCQTHGLIATGGSDYHGPRPTTDRDVIEHPYWPLNRWALPLTLLGPLKAAAQRAGDALVSH